MASSVTRSCIILLSLFALFLAPVSGHVFVKHWKTTSDSDWQPGQKEWKLENTAYRRASDSIGWVGSKFLTANKAIVCGASHTPKGYVAPSGGKFFSDADESAGKTLKVQAGGKVSLVLQGDTGRGYPHYHGHILAYLGKCGPSPTACQSFDASTASYFKIQEVKDGVTQLRKHYSSQLGGDVWDVPIPKDLASGSYIFRFEIITWGESVQSEGLQDQYYPSCGQLYIESDHQASANNAPSIKFPEGYHDGNLGPSSTLPGPTLYSESRRRRSLHKPSKSRHRKSLHSPSKSKHGNA
ncbi:hypothetical protein PGT21_037116 [Puccinia graminis f. sp. tritici]|uniref:lytic cellulose monooxygenase (C4-dehydrogenating) n=2 Tax=Puccinia graminis f. sp. tritici TaxID=56615 RepID=E3L2T4_PUCGT|nr:uncharacterized protein PGTG_17049 [Puccinia graminis f. sp. tritici CRL 75-36-700-3]EFP90850.1 hypothetical protein PGTG_17049 [Puccinia graminis f. sp. tritici CRL 75-36-700-3]KAA1115583.1 hypothetical protein PGT21_037116 [Puccinia graminis f. sp. tritici]KAA1132417.1 hypothetical protein PGTUg99_002357 [Puccinia graminis f. sp. tritici]